jgi:hypothetical protein
MASVTHEYILRNKHGIYPIPAYALKRLLNHKMNHDVTAGYIIMDVERLRKPMQMITIIY